MSLVCFIFYVQVLSGEQELAELARVSGFKLDDFVQINWKIYLKIIVDVQLLGNIHGNILASVYFIANKNVSKTCNCYLQFFWQKDQEREGKVSAFFFVNEVQVH